MISKFGNILSGTQDAILQSIKRTQGLVDKVQLTLASGKDVNRAIDNPQNFFTSRTLTSEADDLRGLLDGITTSIRTIQEADTGANAILQLIDQADALLDEALTELYSDPEITSLVAELTPADISAILADNPGITYSSDSESFYQVVTANANWNTANANAQSATLIEPSTVSGVAGVTGHLAVITSQEENDYINALSPNNTWIGGSDQTVEGEWRWVGGSEDGQQFWQGGTGGSAVNGAYENWRSGEPNNSGNEDGVHLRPDGAWNDQGVGSSYDYVIEWDSSLFVNEDHPELAERAREYQSQYLDIMEQIDFLAKDTQFRGLGLLNSEHLRTDFNVLRTSTLISEGIDATSLGLGLANNNFLTLAGLSAAREEIDIARETLRSYAGSLQVDLGIITARQDFTQININTHRAGADDLVVADQNEKGAELLALQTRQQLQFQALSLSSADPIADLL
ncbi:MAG: hypothetical protein GW778_07480 [Alphaproteobacteria bacterium]|nr:hypothetical protein [Alphaproteobacteria bacterium]